MGDKNVVINVTKELKSTTKNNEPSQTQVFVLPPELLKGLLLENKIPKVNDPSKIKASDTSNHLMKKENLSLKNISMFKDKEITGIEKDKETDLKRPSQIFNKNNETNKTFTKIFIQENSVQNSTDKTQTLCEPMPKGKELETNFKSPMKIKSIVEYTISEGKRPGLSPKKYLIDYQKKIQTTLENEKEYENVKNTHMYSKIERSYSNKKTNKIDKITTNHKLITVDKIEEDNLMKCNEIVSKHKDLNRKSCESVNQNNNNQELMQDNLSKLVQISNNEEALPIEKIKLNANNKIFTDKVECTTANQETKNISNKVVLCSAKHHENVLKTFDEKSSRFENLQYNDISRKSGTISYVDKAEITNTVTGKEQTEIIEEIEFIVEEIEEPIKHLEVSTEDIMNNDCKEVQETMDLESVKPIYKDQLKNEKNLLVEKSSAKYQCVILEKQTKDKQTYLNISSEIGNQKSNMLDTRTHNTSNNNGNLQISVKERSNSDIFSKSLNINSKQIFSKDATLENNKKTRAENPKFIDSVQSIKKIVTNTTRQVEHSNVNNCESTCQMKNSYSLPEANDQINKSREIKICKSKVKENYTNEVKHNYNLTKPKHRSKSLHYFEFKKVAATSARIRSKSLNLDKTNNSHKILASKKEHGSPTVSIKGYEIINIVRNKEMLNNIEELCCKDQIDNQYKVTEVNCNQNNKNSTRIEKLSTNISDKIRNFKCNKKISNECNILHGRNRSLSVYNSSFIKVKTSSSRARSKSLNLNTACNKECILEFDEIRCGQDGSEKLGKVNADIKIHADNTNKISEKEVQNTRCEVKNYKKHQEYESQVIEHQCQIGHSSVVNVNILEDESNKDNLTENIHTIKSIQLTNNKVENATEGVIKVKQVTSEIDMPFPRNISLSVNNIIPGKTADNVKKTRIKSLSQDNDLKKSFLNCRNPNLQQINFIDNNEKKICKVTSESLQYNKNCTELNKYNFPLNLIAEQSHNSYTFELKNSKTSLKSHNNEQTIQSKETLETNSETLPVQFNYDAISESENEVKSDTCFICPSIKESHGDVHNICAMSVNVDNSDIGVEGKRIAGSFQKKKRGRPPKLSTKNIISKNASIKNNQDVSFLNKNENYLENKFSERDFFQETSIDNDILKEELRKNHEEQTDKSANENKADTDNKHEKSADSISTPKRKRGRPPKSFGTTSKISEENINKLKSTYLDSNKDIKTPCILQKRKKGRPSKIISLLNRSCEKLKNEETCDGSTVETNINTFSISYDKQSENEEINTIQPKRRGRPPKSDIVLTIISTDKINIEDNDGNAFTHSDHEKNNELTTCIIANDENHCQPDDTDIKIFDSNAQKKRRERPPKSEIMKTTISTNKINNEDNGSNSLTYSHLEKNNESVTSVIVNDESHFQQDDTEIKVFNSNIVEKKRRGRPSKPKIMQTTITTDKINTEDNDSNTLTHSDLEKNNESTTCIIVNDENHCQHDDTEIEVFNSNIVEKKRRGRPPKSEIMQTTISTDKINNEDNDSNSLTYSHLEKNNEFVTSITVNDDRHNSQEDDTETKVLDSNNAQKKRRGRAPKLEIRRSTTTKKDDARTNDNRNYNFTLDKTQSADEDDTKKKRRGRPSKLKTTTFSISKADEKLNNTVQNDLLLERKKFRSNAKAEEECQSEDNSNINSVKCSQRLSRDLKPTNYEETVDGKGLSDQSENISDLDENGVRPRKKRKYSRKRRKGRPKGSKYRNGCDNDYMPHHSYLHRSPKDKSVKLKSSEPNVQKMVVCGKCGTEVSKGQWPHHNLSVHNDLGWLEGTPKPDFENDEKLLKRVLFSAIKRKRSGLNCEMCNVVKRSVLGYLSHVTFCGKDEEEKQALMVTCPVCKAVTKPASLEYHERLHKMQAEEKERMNLEELDNVNAGTKIKRKAAEKAVTKMSEFTTMDKDKDDSLPTKKLKLTSNIMRKLIQKPQLTKTLPNVVLAKWKNSFKNGTNVICCQVGCEFISKSLDELKEHYSMCNFTPQENFVCKICQFKTLCESEIFEHALREHSTIEDIDDTNLSISDIESYSSDNCSDADDKSSRHQGLVKKMSLNETAELSNEMFKFLLKSGAYHTKYNRSFSSAFQWTLEFEQNNYKFSLFEEYVPNPCVLLNTEEAKKYLPELDQSMSMKSINTSNKNVIEPEWKKWKRFEGQNVQDNPTFFVGGPVWALAWLPIPSYLAFSENISQFVAISTHPRMDVDYSIGQMYSGKNIIQIWDLGNLNARNDSKCNPKLAYAVAHEGGTVWCLDWCPSGCYQHQDLPCFVYESNQLRRMGLLAAACSDGCIRVYSLPFPEDLHLLTHIQTSKINENEYPIYSTEPALILIVNKGMYENNQQSWQVTKLSWTKEREHNVIVAGFSNGYVGLWDLNTESPMLKFRKGNTVFFTPYKYFFAHHHAVTMVYLVPQDNKQFLATASLDRYYKFWDLEDVTSPRNFFKKSFITNGSWLNHWCSALITYDDALSMSHTYSHCLPLRDYTYKYYNIFPTNSTSYAIAASDFGNSIATGTLAGEVLAMFPQQLIYIRDMEKSLPRKRYISMVSRLEVIDFEGVHKEKGTSSKEEGTNDESEYNYMPSTYNDSKNRFGLKFCINMSRFKHDSELPKNHKKTLTCEMMQTVPIERYPFMSANRISWNPNAWSFLWLAVGYQNGFVRLISFNSLASKMERNKHLVSHIDKLKSRTTMSDSS